MTYHEESLTRLLARLPQADVDSARAARVQARCRRVLARTVRPPVQARPRRLESLLFAALSVGYLLAVIQKALP